MFNTRGEYKSDTFDALLKQHRIKILQSASHIPQQNGHVEKFMHTMIDKAEEMYQAPPAAPCHSKCKRRVSPRPDNVTISIFYLITRFPFNLLL